VGKLPQTSTSRRGTSRMGYQLAGVSLLMTVRRHDFRTRVLHLAPPRLSGIMSAFKNKGEGICTMRCSSSLQGPRRRVHDVAVNCPQSAVPWHILQDNADSFSQNLAASLVRTHRPLLILRVISYQVEAVLQLLRRTSTPLPAHTPRPGPRQSFAPWRAAVQGYPP